MNEQSISKHVIEVQFLFTQDFALNAIFLFFSSSVPGFVCLSERRLQIIKALGQLAAESTLRSSSLQHCAHKWCNLIAIINATNMSRVPVLITFHISRLF